MNIVVNVPPALLFLSVIIIGFLLAVGSCALLLPVLRKLQMRQHAYEDAPPTHRVKTGTPTMGGLCFVVALLPILFVSPALGYLFGLVAGCALIGLVDDFLAVRLGRNRGLRARTKFLFTALIAVTFLRAIDGGNSFYLRDTVLVAGGHSLFAPHWAWLILGIVAIAGTMHAVNLTDGLDGLASGSMIFPLIVIAMLAVLIIPWTGGVGYANAELVVFSVPALLGAGACLGFLVYNRYPAKLIMGDTGSLALGALLSGIAILSGEMLLLIVIGFVFVAEALSVMLQVVYFKLSHGKRIFKMSPLHHHFELSGWPETKVTTRFWIASAICSAVGLAIVR